MLPIEHRFAYDGLDIAACEWGDPAGVPVLALHGWLDNCGSFAPLGRLLRGVRLVALDLPGHGHSSHRSADGTYNIWQDVGVVHAVFPSRRGLVPAVRRFLDFLGEHLKGEQVVHQACTEDKVAALG